MDIAQFYQACNPSPLKFANPQDQKYYIDFSSVRGGHARQLLMLIARCLERYDPPFSRDCIEDIIRLRRNELTLAITEDEWIYLREVAQQKSLRGEEKYQILIRDMFVFEYRDSQGSWFDINPMLAEAAEL
ncbi:MAG: hypothetical protein RIG88_01975 [Roseitalea porphyridii]